MKEQFDKELRDHIKDTFDVYNDQMADDGWKKYQQKVRNKKIGTFLIWSLPSGIAAAIALLWLINFNNVPFTTSTQKNIAKNNKQILRDSVTFSNPQKEEAFNIAVENKEEKSTKPLVVAQQNKTIENQNPTSSSRLLTAIDVQEKTTVTKRNFAVALNTNLAPMGFNSLQNSIERKEKVPFSETVKDFLLERNAATSSAFTYTATNEDENKKSVNNRFFKNIKVGLDASTFMNFTRDGINKDLNVAVGVVSEYKISKNLSINTGINLNRQSTNFVASRDEIKESAKSSLAFQNSAAPIINMHSSSAKLVALDIPLAIKYSAKFKKLNWFLSTGFSSSTLLNEKYLNNISIVNYSFAGVQTTNEVTKEENSEQLFSNLQIARTLNFSVGIQVPIKNITYLSVEPFVKYPLSDFGKEHLAIGSSGISFKMNLDKRLFIK